MFKRLAQEIQQTEKNKYPNVYVFFSFKWLETAVSVKGRI